MIYFNGKKWNKSLERLFETKKATNTDLIPQLNKFLNQGKDIYIMFNPYSAEIHEETTFIYDFTDESVKSKFYQLREEV